MHRIPLVLVALLLVTACSKSDSADAGDSASTASSAGGVATAGDNDLGDLKNYELTMDKVNKYGEAMRNLAQSMRNIPESQRPNINASNMSLDQYANALNSNPQIRDAIRRADMTPKDFAYTMFALLSASMASSIIQMRPNDNADSLAREMQANPKNIRFVREHEAEIKQMQEEMSKLEQ